MTARVFGSGLTFFLIWTIGVHVATLAGLPFSTLYGVFVISLIGAVLGAIRPPCRIFNTPGIAAPLITLESNTLAYPTLRQSLAIGALVLVFLLSAGLLFKLQIFEPFWLVCLGTALLALWLSYREAPVGLIKIQDDTSTPDGRSIEVTFVALSLFALAFYFFVSIPDTDDALYLNIAVGAKQSREVLLANDTMLGLPGLDLIKSTYRLETFPLLAALISDLTGWSVLFVAHSVIPAMFCVWAASCLTLLHAAIFPTRFAITIPFHVVALIALDGSLQSYGYHAIPRFFQGKALFVTVMVPLIAVATLCVLRDGRARNLAFLAGLVIISVGLTANAIYAAPLTSALVAFPGFILNANERGKALRLLAIIAYPLAIALFLLVFDPPGPSEHTEQPISSALWSVAGSPVLLLLFLAALFASACAALLHPSLRWVTVYTVGLLALVISPLLWSAYSSLVTGHINVRLLWAVPVPFFLAGLAGVLWTARNTIPKLLFVAAGLLGVVSPQSILWKSDVGLAAHKVPAQPFALAAKINEVGAGKGLVLAPEAVSAWIPVQENASPVVESRSLYIPQRLDPDMTDVLKKRADLYLHWDFENPEPMSGHAFLTLLNEVGVTIVVASKHRESHNAKLEALFADGFEVVWEDDTYRVLVR